MNYCPMSGAILLEYHVPRCHQICKSVSMMSNSEGRLHQANTILGVIIANNLMDLMCIDFTKENPSKDGKENILVLTDAFTKFSQVFVTPNQKVITIAKILVDKCFMCMVFLHVYTAIKAIALTMGSCHICMLCTGLSNLPPCLTIHMECSHRKIKPYINWPAQITTKEQKSNGCYICHCWYLHIMPHHMIQLATSHMS